jgi:phospholipase C
VYEALRAGPKWKNTLLFVTYDDAGGYYDHVVPPHEGVPADDAPCNLGPVGWFDRAGGAA